jgi:hypothetical protein
LKAGNCRLSEERGVCCASSSPALYLEMHGETMAEKRLKVAAIIRFLEEAGYTVIEHIETGQRITTANSQLAVEGHLYCPRIPVAGV